MSVEESTCILGYGQLQESRHLRGKSAEAKRLELHECVSVECLRLFDETFRKKYLTGFYRIVQKKVTLVFVYTVENERGDNRLILRIIFEIF